MNADVLNTIINRILAEALDHDLTATIVVDELTVPVADGGLDLATAKAVVSIAGLAIPKLQAKIDAAEASAA